MDQTDLAIVEWHDGSLAGVEQLETGVLLHFSLVFVYRHLGGEEYDIETCRASLLLEGGSASASTEPKDIADCDIDGPCSADDVQSLLAGVGAGELRFIFTDGTELKTRFQAAKLELKEPCVSFEHWSGPLVTPG